MKKLILLACFGIFYFTGAHAQEIDFTYKVDSVKGNPLRTLQITVNHGEPNFTIYLFKINPALSDPFEEIQKRNPFAKITASKDLKNKFLNLEKGTYYIEVRDNSKLTKGKSITF